jgi:hypothetical protein
MTKTHVFVLAAAIASTTTPALASDKPNAWEQEKRELKPGDGLFVVDTTLAIDPDVVRDSKGRAAGWAPRRLSFMVWGKADSSDKIVVTWLDGKKTVGTTECSIPQITEEVDFHGRYLDQGEVRCDSDESKIKYAGGGVFGAAIALRDTETQKLTPLRTIKFKVVKYNASPGKTPEQRYYVDRDYRLAENFVYWNASGHKGDDSAELTVRTWTKQAGELNADDGKLKCTVDGAAVALDSYTYSTDGFTVEQYNGNKAHKTSWTAVAGTFKAERGNDGYKPGKWECKMLVAGKLLRTFKFELDSSLAVVVANPEQTKQAGALAVKAVFAPGTDVPADADASYDKKAVGELAFMGRPWSKK